MIILFDMPNGAEEKWDLAPPRPASIGGTMLEAGAKQIDYDTIAIARDALVAHNRTNTP
jgi:hypothetical protein